MIPPALPIALATWPSMPGRWAISMRMVSEYWADGVMLIAGAYASRDAAGAYGGRSLRRVSPARPVAAFVVAWGSWRPTGTTSSS